MSDANGAALIGLDKVTSKSSTATVASYPNVSFALAKLMPRTDAAPSELGELHRHHGADHDRRSDGDAAQHRQHRQARSRGRQGRSYKYTFYRDVTAVKAQVAGMTLTNNRAADLGDLTYTATLPHRLTVQISGGAPAPAATLPMASP